MKIMINTKIFGALSILISLIFLHCKPNKVECSDQAQVIASILNNLEPLYYPNLPEFANKSIDNFHLIDAFPIMDTARIQYYLPYPVSFEKTIPFILDEGSKKCINSLSQKRFSLYQVGDTDKWLNNSIQLYSPLIAKDNAFIEVIWSLGKGHNVGVLVILERVNHEWKIVGRHEMILG